MYGNVDFLIGSQHMFWSKPVRGEPDNDLAFGLVAKMVHKDLGLLPLVDCVNCDYIRSCNGDTRTRMTPKTGPMATE